MGGGNYSDGPGTIQEVMVLRSSEELNKGLKELQNFIITIITLEIELEIDEKHFIPLFFIWTETKQDLTFFSVIHVT